MGGYDFENLLAGFAVKGHAHSRLLSRWGAKAVQRQHVRDGVAKRADRLTIAQQKFGEAAAIGEGGKFDLVVGEHDRDGRRRSRSATYRPVNLTETIPCVSQREGSTRFRRQFDRPILVRRFQVGNEIVGRIRIFGPVGRVMHLPDVFQTGGGAQNGPGLRIGAFGRAIAHEGHSRVHRADQLRRDPFELAMHVDVIYVHRANQIVGTNQIMAMVRLQVREI